jgi:hypothetical protein
MPGKIYCIDPLWRSGNWGGLPCVTIDDNGGYDHITLAIHGLMAEMKRRWKIVQQGGGEPERLTVIWDEVPDTVAEVGEVAGELIRRLAQRGRHSNMHLIGIAQSDRVQAWGLQSFGDASQNFATIYLGTKALEKMPSLAGEERPAMMEYGGREIPISLKGVLEESKKPIDPNRVYRLPGVPMTSHHPGNNNADDGGDRQEQSSRKMGSQLDGVGDVEYETGGANPNTDWGRAPLNTPQQAVRGYQGAALATAKGDPTFGCAVCSGYALRVVPDAFLAPRTAMLSTSHHPPPAPVQPVIHVHVPSHHPLPLVEDSSYSDFMSALQARIGRPSHHPGNNTADNGGDCQEEK